MSDERLVGIASYDAVTEGEELRKGERAAVEGHIQPDEPVVRRHWASQISGRNGEPIADGGVALMTTDRQLLVVNQAGTFRSKFKVWSFPLSTLDPVVPQNSFDQFGTTIWAALFQTLSNEAYFVQFRKQVDADEFHRDLSSAVTAYRSFKMGIDPET